MLFAFCYQNYNHGVCMRTCVCVRAYVHVCTYMLACIDAHTGVCLRL